MPAKRKSKRLASRSDPLSQEQRRYCMSRIRGQNTKPEILIRKSLHALGYRFRIHRKDLPGTPDIVLPKYHAAIFVHGCFWHGHDCDLFKWPKSRAEFWREKITKTRKSDADAVALLRHRGWRVLVIWECALRGRKRRPLEEVIDFSTHWLDSESCYQEIEGLPMGL